MLTEREVLSVVLRPRDACHLLTAQDKTQSTLAMRLDPTPVSQPVALPGCFAAPSNALYALSVLPIRIVDTEQCLAGLLSENERRKAPWKLGILGARQFELTGIF
jgi:hypothetical protein